ncbi:MAG: hypothetical protein QOJ50_624, partial [Cryptosporangiaceae bacterium]|nr:hypothetical protein [Cryptosporangiaceae bacterium]
MAPDPDRPAEAAPEEAAEPADAVVEAVVTVAAADAVSSSA